jgi:hypothetical protein
LFEEEKMANETLFSGKPKGLGGLSNEDELVTACPDEFKKENPWSVLAMQLFFNGGKIGHWKFKTQDKNVRSVQLACFKGLISTFGISHEDKEAVAGWMLSEMLEEVPEYIL